jgi:hypothetical protein
MEIIMSDNIRCGCFDCWTDRVLNDLNSLPFVRGNDQETIYEAIRLICALTDRQLEQSEEF